MRRPPTRVRVWLIVSVALLLAESVVGLLNEGDRSAGVIAARGALLVASVVAFVVTCVVWWRSASN